MSSLGLIVAFTLIPGHGRLVLVEAKAAATDAQLAVAFGHPDEKIVVRRASAAQEDARARAEGLLEQARSTWHAGQTLALALRTREAIGKYQIAVGLFVRGALALGDITPLAKCYIDLGAAWLVDGKDEQAMAALRHALALVPQISTDPRLHNPEVTRRLLRLRGELQRLPPAALTLRGVPEGANVFIDGQRKGALPLSMRDLPAGEHVVLVEAAGYEHYIELVSLSGGSSAQRDVFLPEATTAPTAPVLAALEAEPAEAQRLLDEVARADTAVTLIVVSDDQTKARVRTPNGTLSPILSGKNLTALAASVDEWLLTTTAPRDAPSASQPVLLPLTRAPVSPFVAILPFGIGQFAERRVGAGVAFGVTELALLALNLTTAIVVLNDRLAAGTFANGPRDRTLQIVNLTGLGCLVAEIIGGGVDGVLHRK